MRFRHLILTTIASTLEKNKWNRTNTAKELSISVRTVRNCINEAKRKGILPATIPNGWRRETDTELLVKVNRGEAQLRIWVPKRKPQKEPLPLPDGMMPAEEAAKIRAKLKTRGLL